MALYNSYSDLQAAVARWLNREDDPDILDRAEEFIALAEASIRRRQDWFAQLYSMENGGVGLPITAMPMTLPTQVNRINEMWAASDFYKHPITVVTPTLWRDLAATNLDVTGIPKYATMYTEFDKGLAGGEGGNVTGHTLFLWPKPVTDGSFIVDFTFVRDVPPLKTGNIANNGLFQRHPDLYLYGALVESAPFYEHDSRLQMWQDRFDKIVQEINLESERAEVGSSNMRARLPRSF